MYMYIDKKHDVTFKFVYLYLQITPHFYIFSITVKKYMHVSNYIKNSWIHLIWNVMTPNAQLYSNTAI